MKDQYDYIVVGAGSAGCPLAERLSADPSRSVLLLESGPVDSSMFVHMPRGIGLILNAGSKYIWDYQVKTSADAPSSERWFRGRTLGGSSSTNGMVYMRGVPADYNGWEASGCTGWGWDKVGPTFVALEDHDQGKGPWRGAGGPQRITTHPKGDPLCEAILNATSAMGIQRVEDVNDVDAAHDGAMGYQPSTRWRGERFSSAQAFLERARGRPNLDIVTETDVLRVEFEGKRAIGVRVRDKAGERSIRAQREVIISAGAIQTPVLLQHSGIGPASVLEPLGIKVIADSPDVGRNLREHRHVDLLLRVRGDSLSQNRDLGGWRAGWSVLKYMFGRKGPMTHSAHEVGGFAKSDPSLERADLQFGLMSLSADKTNPDKIALDKFPGITFVTYFTRPESQGEVRITSKDPSVQPYINVNHLSAEIDRKKFVAAFRWNRELAKHLGDVVVAESYPGATVQTDEEILAKAMEMSGTCFHTAGTARMGTDERAVLDPQLRVRGVEGLRVADTSIMPTLVSGNTNGPAMMIGMRAAEFILADAAANKKENQREMA